jgi:hypothetical protein
MCTGLTTHPTLKFVRLFRSAGCPRRKSNDEGMHEISSLIFLQGSFTLEESVVMLARKYEVPQQEEAGENGAKDDTSTSGGEVPLHIFA